MPASYPTNIKGFTTKSAGDTIQPAHINDLQDEVMAVEAGLLSGASPITTSNATMAAISATGLQITGNSTITGTLTVATIISTSISAGAGVTSYVRVYAGAPAEVGSASTGTKLALDTEDVDLLSEWDSTSYTFTPQSSGYYQINARGRGITAAVGSISLGLWVNDTLVAEGGDWLSAGVTVGYAEVHAALNLSAGAAGTVQVRGTMLSTGRFSSGAAYTSLDILKVY
jgi:hypothetical protein